MEKTREIERIKRILKENKNYFRSRFHVVNIGIFGSYLSGTQTEKSDIDILVEFEKEHKDFFNYMRLKNYLEELLAVEVDLVMRGAIKRRLMEKILTKVFYV